MLVTAMAVRVSEQLGKPLIERLVDSSKSNRALVRHTAVLMQRKLGVLPTLSLHE